MDTAHASPPTPLSRALETIRHLKARLAQQGSAQPLAVIGMGMRFPGAIDNLDSYWQALAAGSDLVRPMPAARKGRFAAEWDALPHDGGFLDEVTDFDAAFFGISPREARALDPQHRLLLEVAWEALENAALPPDRLTGVHTGLYIGITAQDYRDWLTDAPDAYWATGNGHCFAAGRIAYAMGLTGPAIAVDTACSSGLVAVHLACQALRSGECSVAVAGGVNLVLSPRSTQLVKETRALAPDGLCKTFDARANGFSRGEGCGIVVLKRLDHALRDGDRVHAVIRGSAVNQDGRSSGFTAPNVLAQIALIEAALADAGLTPADIGLVEAHGTGTALGDPIEMEALVAALGKKNNRAPLYVGSVKPNFGHLEAAAGVAGLIKAIACCSRRAIPALVHYRTMNPRIDLAGTGITLPTSLMPWTPDAGRFAGVSAFGLSGTNAHMIVGAPEPAEARPAQPVNDFELTARTPEALRELAARFRTNLAALPDHAYGAFAYTATFGRARHAVRARIAAPGRAAALAALDALATGAPSAAVTLDDRAAPVADLPRNVIDLPHYPWQRERHVPPAPAASRAVAPKTAPSHDPLGDSALRSEPRWSRQPINDSSISVTSQLEPTAAAAREPRAATELRAAPEHARLKVVRHHVRRRVASILGHDQDSAVCAGTSFFDLGLDSLMAVDLARALVRDFGIELAFTDIFEHATVNALAAAVLARIPAAIAAKPAPASSAAVTAAFPPRIAFVFSCQGSQYFGMGRELYDTEPVFRARLDACDRILRPLIGASIKDVMMHGDDKDAIHQTHVTQPVTVALQLALADLWTSWGVTASAVLGHSLGEVAAAIHAGVMDLASGLTLVAHRARLMQSTGHGSMLAVTA
ncbi:MAG: beta-ketoacyl synthase N-terminal-like domain-containing protein, partial [Kofleriaceae bacterium]